MPSTWETHTPCISPVDCAGLGVPPKRGRRHTKSGPVVSRGSNPHLDMEGSWGEGQGRANQTPFSFRWVAAQGPELHPS